ncbi:hypothetical protein, partial [Streptomyces sp. 8L]|uniref:hypothetical protein n=1 Tax=Streptomyces sp. 8L TaxID=2877242 RepID=UPI001CD5BB11
MTQATACQRPDCEGEYEDVGGGELYCDICGLAPVVSPPGSISAPPPGLAAGPAARRTSPCTGGPVGRGGTAPPPVPPSGGMAAVVST